MEMTPHLSEAELADFVSDTSRGVGTHLEYCDSCLLEVSRLRETGAALREAGSRPEAFWRNQHAVIRAQVAAAPEFQLLRLPRATWAFAVLVMAAALLLLGGDHAAQPPQQATAPDPDHELLLEVERVMQSDSPDSLQPAAYLVQEISQEGANSSTAIPDKEMRHEN